MYARAVYIYQCVLKDFKSNIFKINLKVKSHEKQLLFQDLLSCVTPKEFLSQGYALNILVFFIRLSYLYHMERVFCCCYAGILEGSVARSTPYKPHQLFLFFICSLCGTSNASDVIPEFTTHDAVEPSTLLVIFHSESMRNGNGTFKFTVTAERDPCLGDPCHGVPCVRSGSSYRCLFPGKKDLYYPFHCRMI